MGRNLYWDKIVFFISFGGIKLYFSNKFWWDELYFVSYGGTNCILEVLVVYNCIFVSFDGVKSHFWKFWWDIYNYIFCKVW